MNRVVLCGRLPQNPESRLLRTGENFTSFMVACNRYTKGGEETDYISVCAFGNLAENCATYLVKGRRVGVCGRIWVRDWVDGDGQKRRSWDVLASEVHFLSGRPASSSPAGRQRDIYAGFGRDAGPAEANWQ